MATTHITAAAENSALQPRSQTIGDRGLKFDFPLAGTTVFREGDDLGFRPANGDPLRLPGFFKTDASAELPHFIFADLPAMTMGELLERLAVDPASGASWEALYTPQQLPPGGAGDYDDAAGSLVGGVDVLGSLGTYYYSSAVAGAGVDGLPSPFIYSRPDPREEAGERQDIIREALPPEKTVLRFAEDDLMATPQQTGNLALSQYPDATYTLKDGGIGRYGLFSLNPDGSWTYSRTVNIDMMAEGKQYLENFPIVISLPDGSSVEWLVQVDITGDNDAPLLTAVSFGVDDATLVSGAGIRGTIPAGDVDEGDSVGAFHTNCIPVVLLIEGNTSAAADLNDYGTLLVNPDGSWSFAPQTPAQQERLLSLAPGQQLFIIVGVTASDTHGATGSTTLTITVTGTNQAPGFDAQTLQAHTGEDALIAASGVFNGRITAHDHEDDAAGAPLAYAAATRQGLYGTFSLAADGTWTYTLTPGLNINFMAQGRNYVETFIVTVSDSNGADLQQQFTLTIAGDNDVPVITGVSHGATDLNAANGVVLTGRVLATDVDEGDSVGNYRLSGPASASINGVTVNLSDYGVLILQADGSWQFKAQTPEQQARLQGLSNGRILTVTAPVQAEDSNGGIGNGTITIEVNGQNDPPVLDLPSLNAVILEDALISARLLAGTVSATDNNADPLRFSLAGSSAGTYGALTLSDNGRWTYVPTRDINFMVEGQTYTETFRIRVSDGKGGVDEHALTITITGENDAPVVGAVSIAPTDTELYNGTKFSGTIPVADPDAGDTATITQGSVAAARGGTPVNPDDYGVFTLDAAGNWSFQAQTRTQKDNILGLAEGETLVITVPVTATDTRNGTGTSDLVITVAGTNQDPVFVSSSLSAAATEAALMANPVLNGQLAATDPDTGDTLTYGVLDGNGIYGSLGVNPDGTWTYTRTGDISFLPEGSGYTESFTVTVTDGHGNVIERTFTLDISGSNSAPVLRDAEAAGTDSALNAGLVLSGRISGMDPDAGDSIGFSAGAISAMRGGVSVNAADYGALVMNAGGLWNFEAQTQTQKDNMLGLAEGETLVIIMPVTGTDPHGATGNSTLTITVTGTNQAPVFTATTLHAAAHEDDVVSAGSVSGQLSATDPDTGDTLTYGVKPGTGTGTYGSFSVAPDGAWTYTPTDRINQLAEGQTVTETFTAVVSDGHGGVSEQTFTLTLTGNNDAPVLQNATASSDDAALGRGATLSGTITGTDPEGDSVSYNAGSLSALRGSTPVNAGDYGTLVMNAGGDWTFAAVTQAQKDNMLGLREGETLIVTVPVTGTDPYGATGGSTLTITVSGSNQGPVLQNATVSSNDAAMNSGILLSGNIAGTDPEGDSISYSAGSPSALRGSADVNAADYGTLIMGAGGSWTFQAQTQTQKDNMLSLAEGETLVITVPVTGDDIHGATGGSILTITITGTNQGPVFDAASLSDSADEDTVTAAGSISGQLAATDPDTGDTLSYGIKPGTGTGTYGSFTVDPDGTWTYTPTDAINQLAEGQTVTETFTAVVSDGHGGVSEQTFTLTLTGNNDAPVLENATATSNDAALGGGAILSGIITGTDPEGDSISYSAGLLSALRESTAVNAADYGTLIMGTDGAWTFQAQNQTQKNNILGLRDGETLVITVPVTGEDIHGATGGSTLTITIAGTNQGPMLQDVSDSDNDVAMHGGTTLSGSIPGADPEGDSIRYSAGALSALRGGAAVNAADYGRLIMGTGGSWTFQARTQTQKDNMLGLADGEILVITVPVIGTDTHGATGGSTLSITITGTNQGPALQNATASSNDAAMDSGAILSGTITGTDPEGDSISYGAGTSGALRGGMAANADDYGTLVMSADGAWTFEAVTQAQKDNMLGLADGETLVITVPVTGTDTHGATGGSTLTITVTGTNQGPEFYAASFQAQIREDALIADPGRLGGTLSAGDPEGDTVTYTPVTVPGLYGTFTLAVNGTWTYTLHPGLDINFMALGQNYVETFTVTASDSHGATAQERFTLTITGDNDAPVITGVSHGDTDLGAADGVVLTGQVLATDIDAGDSIGNYLINGSLSATISGIGTITLADYGEFILDADGSWQFKAQTPEQQSNLQNLRGGQVLTVMAPVQAQDTNGGIGTGIITIEVNGQANNPPVLAPLSLNAGILEDALLGAGRLNGSVSATDLDGDTLTFSLAGNCMGTYGTLSLSADGNWTYVPTVDINFMAEGDEYTETFRVRVSDGKGGVNEQDLIITITGENDAPVLQNATASIDDAAMHGGTRLSGNITGTDPEGDGITYSAGRPAAVLGGVAVNAADYGTLIMNSDGSWTFQAYSRAQKDKMLGLRDGEKLVITVPVTGTDGTDAGDATLTITVTGANQGPILQAAAVTASDAAMYSGTTLSGSILGTDPEGDAITYAAGAATATLNGVEVYLPDYGVLTMNAGGAWTFQAVTQTQKDNMLGLRDGENLIINVPVSGTDGDAMGDAILTITITGVNQAPDFSPAGLLAQTTEDALIAAADSGIRGVLSAGDPEGDAVSYTPGVQQGLYGAFTLAADGTWNYTLNPGLDINFMAQGQSYVETFTVTVSDSHGAESQQEFSLFIAGDNDAPVITDFSQSALDLGAADGAVLTGRFLATDADEGDSVGNYRISGPVSASVNGVPVDLADYGELTLNTDGSWRLTAQTPGQLANLQALPSGDVLSLTLTVLVQDSHGASGSKTVIIDVNGQNNAPVLTQTGLSAEIGEDALIGAGRLTGTVSATDADNDPLTYSLAGNSAGTWGSLSLLTDGSWTYVPTMDINFMAEWQEYTETFRIRVSDGKGGVAEQDLTITITGDNDAPVVGAVSIAPTDTELYNGMVFSGTIPAADPDAGDSVTITRGSITAARGGTSVDPDDYGVFTLNADGDWTFQAQTQAQKDAMLSLAKGEALIITVPVTGTDTHNATGGSTLTITVTGTNQEPVFVGSSLSASTTENAIMANPELTGQLAATDPDTGDVLAYGLKDGEGNGAYGTLTVNPDGTWTYTRTGDLGFLEPGENVVERFIVTVDDGHGGVTEQAFSLTIGGDAGDGNSFPVLANADAAATDAALYGGLALSGAITGADADGDAISYAGGTVTAVRAGSSANTPVNIADYGALSIDANGVWTFEALTPSQKDAMLSLAEGETLAITVPVTGTDPHGASGNAFLTITVAGTNQAPVFVSASLSAAAGEDALLAQGSLSGRLAATDPDTGDALAFSIKPGTGVGEYGIFSMTAGGEWTYVPSDAINRLAEGQIVTETFTAIVSDGHGGVSEQTFTLTITGDNDAPVLQNATASSDDVAMYSGAPLAGSIAGTDPDGEAVSFSAGTPTAAIGGITADLSDYGVLTMNADGSWTLEAVTQAQKDAMLGLGDGETLIVTVPVTGEDIHGTTGGSTLTITITGANQAPVFTEASLSAAAHEDEVDAAGFLTGQLAATDPDTRDTLTYTLKPGSGTGIYGSFSVNPDGVWSYTPTGDINRLAEGQIITETFTAVVSDGHGGTSEQTFTLTLTGDNDAPELQAATAASTDAALGGGTALSGSITGTDVDGDPITFSAGAPTATVNGVPVLLSDYGVLIVNADGTWSFDAVIQAQRDKTLGLGQDENLVITVPVIGTDPHGATGDNTLTITVTGTNQAPDAVVTIVDTVVIPTHEDAMLVEGFSLKGSLEVWDAEGDAFTYTLLGASVGAPDTVVGLYGVLTVNPVDGSWTYTRFPGMDLNFMTEGQDYLDTFTVFMKDDLGAMAERKITFSISGDNDAPVINGTTQGTIALDPLLGVTVDLTGRILASDVDEGDTVSHYDIVDGSLALDISGQRIELDRLGDVLDGLLDPLDPLLNTVGTVLKGILGQVGRILDNTAGLGNLLILDSDTGRWTLLAAPLNAILSLLEGVTDALRNIPGLDPVLLDTLLVSLPWLDFNRNEDLLSLKVTVTAQDNHGAPAETEITIGILGGNNAPQFGVDGITSGIGEDDLTAAHFITGTLSATDGENDPLTYALADGGHGRYGTLTVSADGTWTYTLTRDISLLAQGEVHTEEFTVMVSDGHGGRDEQTVSIRITGDNDAPVFELASLMSTVLEDDVISRGAASGRLSATDPDNGASLTYSLKVGTGTGTYGTFTVSSTGEWRYTPGAGLAGLARGQLAIESCTVIVTDEHGAQTEQTFTLTVVGTDDVPVVDVTGSLTATETAMLAGGFSLNGRISAHDAGDTYTYALPGASAGSAAGLYGTLTVNPDGSWTYVRIPNMDLNFMAEGQVYEDAFSVLVRDTVTGALVEKQISFSISGDNDAPVLNGTLQDQRGLANPVNNVTDLTGRILAFDVDQGDIIAFSKAGSATLLLDGQPLVLSVTSLLNTVLNTVVLHLTGPILGGLVSSLVTPLLSGTIGPLLNAALGPVLNLLGGAIIDLDEDTGQWTILANSLSTILNGLDGVVNGILGTLINALDDNILISNTVLNAIKNDLLANIPLLGFNRNSSALAVDIPFKAQDSHGDSDTATIGISILGGLNHAPAFTPATLAAAPVTEDALAAAHFITGTLSASDRDAADTLTYAIVTGKGDDWGAHGKYGSLTLNKATGRWTYTLTGDISFMALGESYVETFQVVVRDGRGGQDVQTLRITISGENDAPVFDVASLNPLVTDESFTDQGFASGQLSATDPDTGAVLTYSVKDGGTGAYGRLTVSATGEWRYTPSALLARGQVETETFIVVVTDEHGAATEETFTLTVVGTNRAPEATITAEANVIVTDEDAMLADGFSIHGSLRLHDPEGNTPGTYTLLDASGAANGSVAGLYGILTLAPGTGNWTYVRFPGMDLNFMSEGETYTDTFKVLVEDSLGATAEREIVFSITGRNDAPVITGVSQGVIQLNPLNGSIAVDLTGRILAFDIDEGDTVSRYDVVDGSLVLDISGRRVDLSHLGDVLDGLLDPLDPLLNLVGTLLNNILGQVGRILDNTAGLGDLLILDSDTGQWTLAAGPLNTILGLLEGVTDALRAIPGVDAILDPLLVSIPWLGFKRDEDLLSLKVRVTAEDNHGAQTGETEITIGILGGNNAPRFAASEVTRDIGEAELIAAHFITGTLLATDGENDLLTYAAADSGHGRYGMLNVLADGTWTYTLTKDVSGPAQGQTYAETFTVMVSDGHGGQDEQTLRINIAGTGDGAARVSRASSMPEQLAAENSPGHLITQEEESAEPMAAMDTLNEEYGPLNALLLLQTGGMEPQEDTLPHTLLHEGESASLYLLPGEEHAAGFLPASLQMDQDARGVQEDAEGHEQEREFPLGLALADLLVADPGLAQGDGMAADLGGILDGGMDTVLPEDVPFMDSVSAFEVMHTMAPGQEAELLALQIALHNG